MTTRVLTSGPFSCTADHAVEVARMVSNLEAISLSGADLTEALDVFAGYLRGRSSPEEVNATFYSEWPEVLPGWKPEVAVDA